jgi:hypothetical protein
MKQPAAVGRGRPPIHSQFKPGTSGNPSGRPKGARALTSDLMSELAEMVEVGDGPRRVRVTKQRAIVIALLREAMKGDLRAVDTVMRACVPASQVDAEQDADAPEDAAIVRTLGGSTATEDTE